MKHTSKSKYLLNSAVITAPGVYSYRLLTVEDAQQWINALPVAVSSIGYAETAEALSQLLRHDVPVNRATIAMQKGDEALVFRLVLPPGSPRIDPKDKGALGRALLLRQFELGLLQRVQ